MKKYIILILFANIVFCIKVSSQTALVEFMKVQPHCGKSNGTINAKILSAENPDYYYWKHGELSTTAKYLSAGVYTFVISILGKEYYETVTLSDIEKPTFSAIIKDEQCLNSKDGSIEILGSGLHSILFLETGTSGNMIKNLIPGKYTIAITGNNTCKAFEVYEIKKASPLSINESLVPASCSLNDGIIQLEVKGGVKPFHISLHRLDTLLQGSTLKTNSNANFESVSAGVYKAEVKDSNNCSLKKTFVLQSKGSSEIQYTANNIIEQNKEISDIQGSHPPFTVYWKDTTSKNTISHSWIFDMYLDPVILIIKDNAGCENATYIERPKNHFDPPAKPTNICVIMVDSTTGNTLIIWEKHDESDGVIEYEIMREGLITGIYTTIGKVKYSELPIFVDTIANPTFRSWKYKIRATSYGNYDNITEHKCIHLSLKQEKDGSPVNLIWDNYIGFAFDKYFIYRGDSSKNETCIDSISTHAFPFYSYSDNSAPEGYLYYYIMVKTPSVCNPANLKIKEGPYDSSISNLEDNRLKQDTSSINTNIKLIIDRVIEVYPNPASERIFIKSHLEGTNYIDIIDDKGFNMISQQVYIPKTETIVIETTGWSKGFYIIKIRNQKVSNCGKFFIQ